MRPSSDWPIWPDDHQTVDRFGAKRSEHLTPVEGQRSRRTVENLNKFGPRNRSAVIASKKIRVDIAVLLNLRQGHTLGFQLHAIFPCCKRRP